MQGDDRLRVDDAAAARMHDRAAGVTSLRGTAPTAPASLSPKRRRALALGVGLAALAVVVCAFFLFKSLLSGLGQAGARAPAAAATDAYVVLAVVDDSGALTRTYVAYVDSIEGRSELCAVEPDTSTQVPGVSAGAPTEKGGTATLAQVWEKNGLSGIASSLSQMGGIQVVGGAKLTAAQMDQLLALAAGELPAAETSALVEQVASASADNAGLGVAQLCGMFATMAQVGSDGLALLQAPTSDTVTSSGANVKVLTAEAWITMLKGMKDTSGDVGA